MGNNQNTKPNQTSNSVSYRIFVDGASFPIMVKQEFSKLTNSKTTQKGAPSSKMAGQESSESISHPVDNSGK